MIYVYFNTIINDPIKVWLITQMNLDKAYKNVYHLIKCAKIICFQYIKVLSKLMNIKVHKFLVVLGNMWKVFWSCNGIRRSLLNCGVLIYTSNFTNKVNTYKS